MKKVLLALATLTMLLCAVMTASAADDAIRMVYWPGPESDAMQVVIDYWNANKAEEAGFTVDMELFGRDNIMLKQEALTKEDIEEIERIIKDGE